MNRKKLDQQSKNEQRYWDVLLTSRCAYKIRWGKLVLEMKESPLMNDVYFEWLSMVIPLPVSSIWEDSASFSLESIPLVFLLF